MDTARPSIAYLAQEGGAVGQDIGRLVGLIYSDSSLTPRARELIFMAVFGALDLSAGIRSHMPRAKAAGCTRAEIVAALMQSAPHGGIKGLLFGLPVAIEEMDRHDIT